MCITCVCQMSQASIYSGITKKPLYIGRATSLKNRVKSYFAADLIKTRGTVGEAPSAITASKTEKSPHGVYGDAGKRGVWVRRVCVVNLEVGPNGACTSQTGIRGCASQPRSSPFADSLEQK